MRQEGGLSVRGPLVVKLRKPSPLRHSVHQVSVLLHFELCALKAIQYGAHSINTTLHHYHVEHVEQ
jgi:hypothetical protein